MYLYAPDKVWSQRTIHNDYFPLKEIFTDVTGAQSTQATQTADSVGKQEIPQIYWNGYRFWGSWLWRHARFRFSRMCSLTIYVWTHKRNWRRKVGFRKWRRFRFRRWAIHITWILMQMNLTRTKRPNIGKFPIILLLVFLKSKSL